jgi:hypothetical protein
MRRDDNRGTELQIWPVITGMGESSLTFSIYDINMSDGSLTGSVQTLAERMSVPLSRSDGRQVGAREISHDCAPLLHSNGRWGPVTVSRADSRSQRVQDAIAQGPGM